MKKVIIFLPAVIFTAYLNAQQLPISENYFMDRSSLSPAYSGHADPRVLFTSYRSDWTGIEGGPKSLRISYSDFIMNNATWAARIIYDDAGIFKQFYVMGTYSYNLVINEEQRIMMALSAGLYHNKLNFSEYYNDPNYNLDPVLINEDVRSKLKFMTDFSFVYLFKGLETGVMFANINFGDAKYKETDVTYKPLANFQFHTAYTHTLSEKWKVNPLICFRDGRYIKGQIAVAARMIYQGRLWGSLSFRDPSIWGLGIGGEIIDGIRLAYNFNLSSSVEINVFNNHEVALGLDIGKMLKKAD